MNVSLGFAILASLILLSGLGPHQVEASETSKASSLQQAVQTLAKKDAFTGSVLVAKSDTILVDLSFGFADRDIHLPNALNSQFRIGSLTKPLTASLVLLLQQDGKIGVKDRASKYLTDAPALWRSITIENLLGHTSGIPDFTDDVGFVAWAAVPRSHLEEINLFRDKPLNFRPGTRFEYSNSNYALLGEIIEAVTKQSYNHELRTKILDRLQMSDTGLDSDGLALPRRALGYRVSDGQLVRAGSESMSIPWAAGGMYSTTHDLFKWLRALGRGELLSAASFKQMTKPGKGSYGLGIGVGLKHGMRAIWHDGSIEGFNSYLVYLPDREISVIALANQDGGSAEALALKILDSLLAR